MIKLPAAHHQGGDRRRLHHHGLMSRHDQPLTVEQTHPTYHQHKITCQILTAAWATSPSERRQLPTRMGGMECLDPHYHPGLAVKQGRLRKVPLCHPGDRLSRLLYLHEGHLKYHRDQNIVSPAEARMSRSAPSALPGRLYQASQTPPQERRSTKFGLPPLTLPLCPACLLRGRRRRLISTIQLAPRHLADAPSNQPSQHQTSAGSRMEPRHHLQVGLPGKHR